MEESAIRELADRLSMGEVRSLASEGVLFRETAEQTEATMEPYSKDLTRLPQGAFEIADLAQFGPSGEEFILDLPLWSARGRTDLVASFIIRRRAGRSEIGVWDVRVP